MQRDESLDKLVYELQILRGFAENIHQRIDLINNVVVELRLATATLEGIESDGGEGSLTLIPIGGGSYIQAKLADVEKLIVGIGANVAVDKTFEEAKEHFQARIIELEQAGASLKQQLDETAMRMDKTQREIRMITEQGGAANDVRGA